jgi:sterol desaturase/sphingolipid hydroxylase (fatty acid hydroxylase superfamily)
MYVVFSELFGHSGVRVLASPPSTLTWLLRLGGVELVVEDHDLHHRKGWKKSSNYGKQTRLWDWMFGTSRERIECVPSNIDYNTIVEMPLFSKPTPPSKS